MAEKNRKCTFLGCGDRTVARRLCRKHYQERWRSGRLGEHSKLPPRERKRTVCPADHRHAESTTCYVQHQCRCDDCCTSHNALSVRRNKLKAYGRFETGLVDVGPAREHLLMLGEFGLGYKRVASLAGIGVTAVRTILWGRQDPGPRSGELQKRVKRETAEAILRVRPTVENLAPGARIPARGVHRRLQALAARGWSISALGARMGLLPSNTWEMLVRDTVTVSRYREVFELYEELWDQSPPAASHRQKISVSRSLNLARQRGWVPPMAWDDIDLDVSPSTGDSEDEVFDEQVVELASLGFKVQLSHAERRAAVERLHAQRLSDAAIARRVGCTDRSVLRIRGELELPGWSKSQLVEAAGEARRASGVSA